MARRKISKQEREHLPKLEPGDKVPHTGLYRLDDGVRIKPVKKSKNRTQKTAKLKRIRGFGGRSRSR
jgi:ribosomal protein L19